MKSISNDHPSAYYRCDYEPFVCFIMALNLGGLNECKTISPEAWKVTGIVYHGTQGASLHIPLWCRLYSTNLVLFRVIHGLYWDCNESGALKNPQRIKHE